jgi:N-glycosidase YbiA
VICLPEKEVPQKARHEILFSSRYKETAFLSNFYPCVINIDGKTYASVEHYYQSQKTLDPTLSEWMRNAPSALYVKKLTEVLRRKDVRTDWQEVKVGIMRRAIRAKFTQNENLKKKLLDTGDAVLHEDVPDELFWGMAGQDMLGKMLMELREELR